MKISLNWLKEFVDIDVSPQQLRHDLVLIGLGVESLAERNSDWVYELEITSNRPDCLNHLGVAREISAFYEKPLREPEPPPAVLETQEERNYSVEIFDTKHCSRYCALLMDNLTVGPSPTWLQDRLIGLGQRPVNNIVDITNYVLSELGHPLHAFDFSKLEGGKIIVRAARKGEKLVTLDGVERVLDNSRLVIADATKPVALAGIMGGLESEISPATKTLLLESAYFDPGSIRRSAKKLGLSTEASYRFERGADINAPPRALLRTRQLISELAGGKVCGSLIDVYPKPKCQKWVKLRHKKISRLVGLETDRNFVEKRLQSLQFQIERISAGVWKVQPPTFRVDIELEADLIEEIARHYGYDKVPTTFLAWRGIGCLPPHYEKEKSLTTSLKALGFDEVVNWSFVNVTEETAFRQDGVQPLSVSNPLSEVDSILRPSLLPSLMKVVIRNLNHGTKNIKIFELGKVYFQNHTGIGEQKVLSMALTGEVQERNWTAKPENVSFFHLKGVIQTLLDQLMLRNYEILPAGDIPFLHPSISAKIYHDGDGIGIMGRLEPSLEETYKVKQEVFLAQLALEKIVSYPVPDIQYKKLPKFPAVLRDVSFIIDSTIDYSKIERDLYAAGIAELAEIRLFDVYKSEQISSGKKSLSIRLKFLNPERTLRDEEVAAFTNAIRQLLREQFHAELR